MKKGQIRTGKICELKFPNKGILVCQEEDGKITKVTVKGTLPGQVVKAQVNKKRSGNCEARLLEVIEKSEMQSQEAKCPHFGDCGGCVYQDVPYEKQLELKASQVKTIIDEVCENYEFEGIIGSPESFEYRNKMEFSFGDEYKDGPLALGLHKKGSFHDIVSIKACKIVNDDYNVIVKAVLSYFKDMDEYFFDLVTTSKWDECGQAATLSESDMLDGLKDKLLGLELNGKIAGILHTYNDSLSDVVQSDKTDILYGCDYIIESILGLNFKISPFSFFQTNSLGAEVLYEKARSYVGETKNKVIFDLYSGTGTIAQMLAPVAKRVTGVEIIEEAVEAAKINAALNGLDNCSFIAGDVLKVIDELTDKPDLIVLDPPRDGINPKALTKIIDFGVDRMVYISCKPTSLARDLVMLQERGYKVEKVCAVDMFPGTTHVETVALLSLKTNQPKLEVTMEVDSESNYTEEERVTYGKIKEYVRDKYGVNVHTSYIAQVKRMCGIDMGECYNKSKKDDAEVKQCPQEKVEYIKDALRYFCLI